jgi:Family of unknown function (DUF6134)
VLPFVAFLLGLLVASAPSLACVLPAERAVYRVDHETFGNIGRQVLTFSCSGDRLVVDTTVDVAVRMLLFTPYRQEAHYREVWEGDRLVSFESHTDDNGRILEVSARAVGERIVIDGPNGHSEAPLMAVPDHPWNHDVVGRTLLFDPVDGTVRRVEVADAGKAPLEVDGRQIMARKYLVSGDLKLELWYDENGAWLKWRMHHGQGAVTMTRQLPGIVAEAGLQ